MSWRLVGLAASLRSASIITAVSKTYVPMDTNASSGEPCRPGGSAGFSWNASIRPPAAARITPKSVATVRGTPIAATVTPASQSR